MKCEKDQIDKEDETSTIKKKICISILLKDLKYEIPIFIICIIYVVIAVPGLYYSLSSVFYNHANPIVSMNGRPTGAGLEYIVFFLAALGVIVQGRNICKTLYRYIKEKDNK